MQVKKQALQGHGVRLEPLSPTHRDELAAAIMDGELWNIRETLVPHPDDLEMFFRTAQERLEAGTEMPFAIRDLDRGIVVGSTRFMNVNPLHRRVEIGFTFLAKSAQRTHINTACKCLLLEHAFEHWNANRVELLTDLRNTKSRAAIARIGARQEGVLRAHMIMRDGWVRDSVLFAFTRRDWDRAKPSLLEHLPTGGSASAASSSSPRAAGTVSE